MEQDTHKPIHFYDGVVCLGVAEDYYFHTSLVRAMKYKCPILRCETMNSVYEFEIVTEPETFNIFEFTKGDFK